MEPKISAANVNSIVDMGPEDQAKNPQRNFGGTCVTERDYDPYTDGIAGARSSAPVLKESGAKILFKCEGNWPGCLKKPFTIAPQNDGPLAGPGIKPPRVSQARVAVDIKGLHSVQLLHVAGVLKRGAQQASEGDAALYLKTARALQARAQALKQAQIVTPQPAEDGRGANMDIQA